MTKIKESPSFEIVREEELSNAAFLHRFHEVFYTIFHLPLDWIPPDNRTFTVCGKSHCNALCSRIMESETGAQCCRDLETKIIEKAQCTRKPVILRCHAGFNDVVIPIFVEDIYLGSLCFGQYLSKQPTKAQCGKIEKSLTFLNLQPGELAQYYSESRVLTPAEANALIDLLQFLGTFICQTYGRWQFLEAMGQLDRIRQSTQYIQCHYTKAMTVDGLARAVGMSKSNFIHNFTRQTGYSPIEYLNRFRISKAVEMLKNSKMNVSEVAYQCGFSTMSLFNRLFLRYVGKTPREIRYATIQ